MVDLVKRAKEAMDCMTRGKPVQFSPMYCEEAKGAKCTEWDTSHDLSVIRADGSRYRIGTFRHADDALFDQLARDLVPEMTARIEALTAERHALRAQVDVLVAATKRLPDGEWETWTSCSFRRISRVGGGDGDVLHAYKQRADGHPDLSWTEDQCKAICDVVNGLRALAQQEGAKG